jgi:diketogulonate reductase-like aldo/keto reductase
VDKGFAVIPKSSSYERMLKNASSLDLNMDTTALDRLESEPVRFCWDPTDVK